MSSCAAPKSLKKFDIQYGGQHKSSSYIKSDDAAHCRVCNPKIVSTVTMRVSVDYFLLLRAFRGLFIVQIKLFHTIFPQMKLKIMSFIYK